MEREELERELKEELQKELDLGIEKERLKETINIINQEINNYIEKRREISEYILGYRKEVLEEYKDDEDKIIEYFDHERFVAEEQFKVIDRRLKELVILKPSPYFGKVNFIEEEIGLEESMYIGRFSVIPKDEFEPIVVDWRAPISSLFYAGKTGEVYYTSPNGEVRTEVLNKRQFVIKKAQLLGMFDSAIDIKDDILQMVLSKNATSKLKDIVMTIQAEQDNLIRQPKDKTIVVDGVAGSGKTTIALHRVAYLLYNNRKTLQDKVLILGPNKVFMEYISTVLPSLGEVGVRQTTFRDLAMELSEIDSIMSFKEYMENVLSGNKEFINEMLYKNSDEYIEKLDLLIRDLEDNYFELRDISIYNKMIISKQELQDLFQNHFKAMPLFKRNKRTKRIIYTRINELRNDEIKAIEKKYKEKINALSEESLNLEGSELEFKKRLEIREAIEESIKAKQGLRWINGEEIINIYRRFNQDKTLTYDDLAAVLYLKIKLEGFAAPEEIKHVVIDEAQDYSKLQFMVINELTKCQSLTIVGDSNQRLLPIRGEVPMCYIEKYLSNKNVQHFKLDKSYRSTKQIMEFANKYIQSDNIVPLVRSGEEVEVTEFKQYEDIEEKLLMNISKLKEKGHESIAIICRDLEETNKIAEILKDKMYIKVIDNEEILYTSGEVVIPSYFAKGLEFDAVIVIDTNNEIENKDKMLYVMSTRALHELYVYEKKC
ncbi:DNA helicase-2/ATP-dependent DNA helicase PcrA [Clostridium pascui]|uniref:HelD family protein n=1 Tax=Clostridium pascui TaxID=46609 RepID=UPI00195DCFAD|nr:UvrD-helicase domain-containing protein [Clostridium pascui]MBM7870342.1 DNA helicase-2/ATP-dependent DNA helicase PcrA [Clostridium pascui]